MKTKRLLKHGSVVYLQGKYENYTPTYFKIIGSVYDREFKSYLYNLMTSDRHFVIREEDYIRKYMVKT